MQADMRMAKCKHSKEGFCSRGMELMITSCNWWGCYMAAACATDILCSLCHKTLSAIVKEQLLLHHATTR